MMSMQGEAASAGGAVVMLLGNHELMNLGGDYRYVAPGELAWLARNFTDAASAGAMQNSTDRKLSLILMLRVDASGTHFLAS